MKAEAARKKQVEAQKSDYGHAEIANVVLVLVKPILDEIEAPIGT